MASCDVLSKHAKFKLRIRKGYEKIMRCVTTQRNTRNKSNNQ